MFEQLGLNGLQLDILRHVAKHDGEWYWYQLDRVTVALDPENLSGKLMPAIKALESTGFIEIRPNPTLDDKPRYWLTELGRLALESRA